MKNLMNKIRKANKGFTLVELIIVIAIIAILTAVAAPQYVKYVDKGRLAKDQNEAASLQTVVEAYIIDVNSNDSDTDDVDDVTVKMTSSGVTVTTNAGLTTEIGNELPGVKVTNKGTYSTAHKVFTITVTDGKVASTAWSAS